MERQHLSLSNEESRKTKQRMCIWNYIPLSLNVEDITDNEPDHEQYTKC
jgi:hypothetical protein